MIMPSNIFLFHITGVMHTELCIWITSFVKEEMLNDWRNSMFHKLIGDESTEISVSKMFIIYLKYRKLDEISYYKIFRGINIWRMIKLTWCDSSSITEAIMQSYAENNVICIKWLYLLVLHLCQESEMIGQHFCADVYHIY